MKQGFCVKSRSLEAAYIYVNIGERVFKLDNTSFRGSSFILQTDELCGATCHALLPMCQ